ncbi:unnamed protein product [Malus baccata var. baccata]
MRCGHVSLSNDQQRIPKITMMSQVKGTLRRKWKQPEPNPPSSSSEAESEFEEEEEEEQVIAADNHTIKELSASGLDNDVPLCIQYPMAAQGKTNEFKLKSSLLYHIPKYHGLSMEGPNEHLKEFEVISGIQQNQGESFPAYYDRFKALVASCLQHQMKEELLLQYFYEGLLPIERQISKVQGYTPSVCGVCSMQGHLNDQSPQLIENGGWESANAIGYQGQNQQMNDPYSNTYNSVWRDHPNFKLREPEQPNNKAISTATPWDISKAIRIISTSITICPTKLKKQGKLPSSTIVNSKGGFETAKAITLRSGKELRDHKKPSKQGLNKEEKLLQEEEQEIKATAREESTLPQPPKASKPSQPIKQVPKYAKFLKELCTTRKRISNKEVIQVSENVFAVLQRKLPPKCKDSGSFTIPCVIGNTKFEHDMLDLGALINVMPYSIYASMNLGELKNDGVIIQLADRSNAYPKGVLEDVLVHVNNLIFPADFYVLDMEDSAHSTPLPILLGRPFMKTATIKIDVFKGTLTMEFDGEIIDFNISEAIKFPKDDHSCFSIDVFDSLAQDYLDSLDKYPLETTIAHGIGLKSEGAEVKHTYGMDREILACLNVKKRPRWLQPLNHCHNMLVQRVKEAMKCILKLSGAVLSIEWKAYEWSKGDG